MIVKELIAILENEPQDAEVMVMTQKGWPFELSIDGVAVRNEFDEELDENGAENTGRPNLHNYDDKQATPDDVFILADTQVRYGNKDAWEVARRC